MPPVQQWQSLEFSNLTFRYRKGNAVDEFALGPLDLTLRRGEIVIVGGGNGNGKTTFAKVMTGLYEPSGGAHSRRWTDGRVPRACNSRPDAIMVAELRH